MSEQPRDVLGVPRTLAILIAVPGLLAFWVVMGIAGHAMFAEYVPTMPHWLSASLSVALPVLFVLGVGVWGALHDQPETHGIVVRFSRYAKWIIAAIMLAIYIATLL